jgi:hypothetical protein
MKMEGNPAFETSFFFYLEVGRVQNSNYDCDPVCKPAKTGVCYYIIQKQKEVHGTPLIWRPRAPDQGSMVGGLLSVSVPEEYHERRTFCRRGSNPRLCDNSSAINS